MIVGQWFFLEHVQPRPRQLAFLQSCHQRPRVDHGSATRIHQVGTVLHVPEALGVDQMMGAVVVRDMEGEEIGGSPELGAGTLRFWPWSQEAG